MHSQFILFSAKYPTNNRKVRTYHQHLYWNSLRYQWCLLFLWLKTTLQIMYTRKWDFMYTQLHGELMWRWIWKITSVYSQYICLQGSYQFPQGCCLCQWGSTVWLGTATGTVHPLPDSRWNWRFACRSASPRSPQACQRSPTSWHLRWPFIHGKC